MNFKNNAKKIGVGVLSLASILTVASCGNFNPGDILPPNPNNPNANPTPGTNPNENEQQKVVKNITLDSVDSFANMDNDYFRTSLANDLNVPKEKVQISNPEWKSSISATSSSVQITLTANVNGENVTYVYVLDLTNIQEDLKIKIEGFNELSFKEGECKTEAELLDFISKNYLVTNSKGTTLDDRQFTLISSTVNYNKPGDYKILLRAFVPSLGVGTTKEIKITISEELKVVFVDAEGNILSSVPVKNGKAEFNGKVPEMPNDKWYDYTFKGWDHELTNITESLTVKPVYEKQEKFFILTVKDGQKVADEIRVPKNETVGLYLKNLEISKLHNKFDGLYKDSDCIIPLDDEDILESNLTVYVKWIEEEKTITIIEDGKEIQFSRPYSKLSELLSYQTEKEDFVCEGLYKDAAFKYPVKESDLNVINKVYVKLIEKTYSITVMENGKEVHLEKNVSKLDEILAYKPDVLGYTFGGLYKDSNFTVSLTKEDLKTVDVVYAKLVENSYTFTIHENDKTRELIFKTSELNDLLNYDFEQFGYTFNGLFKDQLFKNEITIEDLYTTKDIYVKLTEQEFSFIIHENGINKPMTLKTSELNNLLNYNSNVQGYTSLGVYLDSSFTTKLTVENLKNAPKDLYVKLEEKTYVFNIIVNEKSEKLTYSYTNLDKVLDYKPVIEGYQFEGLYLDAGFTKPVTKNELLTTTTIYAKLKALNFDVNLSYSTIQKEYTVNKKIYDGYLFLFVGAGSNKGLVHQKYFAIPLNRDLYENSFNVCNYPNLDLRYGSDKGTVESNLILKNAKGYEITRSEFENERFNIRSSLQEIPTGVAFGDGFLNLTKHNWAVGEVKKAYNKNSEKSEAFTSMFKPNYEDGFDLSNYYNLKYNTYEIVSKLNENECVKNIKANIGNYNDVLNNFANNYMKGYHIDGYYIDPDFKVPLNKDNLRNMNVYVKATPETYNFKIYENGETSNVQLKGYELNDIYNYDVKTPGYNLDSLYIDASFHTKLNNQNIYNAKNVYVKLVEKNYNISYVENIPGVSNVSKTYRTSNLNSALNYSNAISGYKFEGLYLDNNFNTKLTSVSQLYNLKGTIKIYVKRSENIYNINFITSDGSKELKTEVKSYPTSRLDNVLSYNPYLNGYAIEGYYKDASFKIPVNKNDLQTIQKIYVKASMTSKTVNIHSFDGKEELKSETKDYTASNLNDILNYDPALEGYDIEGYYKDASFQTKLSADDLAYISDVYVKLVERTLTFTIDGQSYNYKYFSRADVFKEKFYKVGHTFNGLYTDVDLTVKADVGNINTSKTLYTSYTELSYNLRCHFNGTKTIYKRTVTKNAAYMFIKVNALDDVLYYAVPMTLKVYETSYSAHTDTEFNEWHAGNPTTMITNGLANVYAYSLTPGEYAQRGFFKANKKLEKMVGSEAHSHSGFVDHWWVLGEFTKAYNKLEVVDRMTLEFDYEPSTEPFHFESATDQAGVYVETTVMPETKTCDETIEKTVLYSDLTTLMDFVPTMEGVAVSGVYSDSEFSELFESMDYNEIVNGHLTDIYYKVEFN